MAQFLLVVHILISFALIGLVLIQQGKGADVGAAFGSGASGTVFGASGSGNFLTRLTGGLATAFFINCLILAYLSSHEVQRSSVMDRVQLEQPESAVVVPEESSPLEPIKNTVAPDEVPVVPE